MRRTERPPLKSPIFVKLSNVHAFLQVANPRLIQRMVYSFSEVDLVFLKN
jgi:hypothetical protein